MSALFFLSRRHWWPLGLYRVAGDSMQPTYQPGDTLVGWRWFHPRVGQVVVAHVAGRLLIKRLTSIDGTHMHLAGDNAAHSTDSRHFGPVSRLVVEALILTKLP